MELHISTALIDGSLYNVSDSAIGVSSTLNIDVHGPQCSRFVTAVDGCSTTANQRLWIAHSWDDDPWIQVNTSHKL